MLGLANIKAKQKRKQANLVKDFIFSSVDEEGQMVMLFLISINLTEVLERFGQLCQSSAVLLSRNCVTKERSLDLSLLTLGDSLSWILLKQEVSPYNLYELFFLLLPWLKVFLLLFPKKTSAFKTRFALCLKYRIGSKVECYY